MYFFVWANCFIGAEAGGRMVIDLTDNLKGAAIKITNFTYVGEALRVADWCQQPLQRFCIE